MFALVLHFECNQLPYPVSESFPVSGTSQKTSQFDGILCSVQNSLVESAVHFLKSTKFLTIKFDLNKSSSFLFAKLL